MCERNVHLIPESAPKWMFILKYQLIISIWVTGTPVCGGITLLLFTRWAGSWRTWWICCVGTLQVSPWPWRNARRARSPQPRLCLRTWDGNRWLCKYDDHFHPPHKCLCTSVCVQICIFICVHLCASVLARVKNKTAQTADTRHQIPHQTINIAKKKINRGPG